MESESSLPCSQKSATGPYLESDESNPLHVAYVVPNMLVRGGSALIGCPRLLIQHIWN